MQTIRYFRYGKVGMFQQRFRFLQQHFGNMIGGGSAGYFFYSPVQMIGSNVQQPGIVGNLLFLQVILIDQLFEFHHESGRLRSIRIKSQSLLLVAPFYFQQDQV